MGWREIPERVSPLTTGYPYAEPSVSRPPGVRRVGWPQMGQIRGRQIADLAPCLGLGGKTGPTL